MKNAVESTSQAPRALLYCRVSDRKQRTQGSGLDSQEQRCRKYADERGYEVEMVFPDDVSGGGDFMKRPGMRAMLAYLDAQPTKNYVVIFDDLKRFARDTRFHLELRSELAARGAVPECLNFKFEDSPEGKFIETMMAATGQLEREQNRRQVVQKMKARVESGYWVFRAPVGYKHVPAPGGGGKILVPDEPLSLVVREALEGYASGRFASQAEVQRFLEANPYFPKDRKDGSIRPMTIKRLLTKVVYAGYVEAPKWGVSLRKGNHDALISFETFQRIQDTIEGKKRAPAARKDYNVDFPLRGFVTCKSCGNAMTAAWSKGKYRHYPYYLCQTRGCSEKGKSVARAKIEAGFEELMQRMVPSRALIKMVTAMFDEAWALRGATAREEQAEWKNQLKAIEKQIEETLDKIMEAENKSVVRALEKRIDKLEQQTIVLSEKTSAATQKKRSKRECIELCLQFLSNPCFIYKNGDHAVKQTVLKLAFVEPVQYCRKEGYRTPKLSLPFKVLEDITSSKNKMVLLERIELSTSPLPRECSTSELQQRRARLIRPKQHRAQPIFCLKRAQKSDARPCRIWSLRRWTRVALWDMQNHGADTPKETTGQVRSRQRNATESGAQGEPCQTQGPGQSAPGQGRGHITIDFLRMTR